MLKKRKRDINIFNLSMLDVISGAMGAFLLVMLVLVPYYRKTLSIEEGGAISKKLDAVRARLNDIRQALDQIQSEAMQARMLEDALEQTRQALEDVRKAHDRIVEQARQDIRKMQQRTGKADRRLGFVLSERNLVLIIDVSGSMGPDGENSIVAVVAGVKMLIATMNDRYRVDIVFFPNTRNNHPYTRMDREYGYLWGEMREVTLSRKYEAYRFLSALAPYGGTPTESAFDYVFSSAAYHEMGAIILLTDGEPVAPDDFSGTNYPAYLTDKITRRNRGRVRINAIGVGADFRDRRVNSDAERFLKRLAEKNDGFYVGF